jgi:HlyD family secretion protein
MPSNNHSNINLSSPEVQEIVSSVPHWIVRWGITLFFLIVMMLFFLSWIIHYPDLIKAPFRLTALNAPQPINSKINGKLVRLLVKDKSYVQPGQVLAYLECTADHKEVLKLADELDLINHKLNKNQLINFKGGYMTNYNHLGELQKAYEIFNQSCIQFASHQQGGIFIIKRNMILKELLDLAESERNLAEQKKLYQRDLELARIEFEMQKDLAKQKVIAIIDLGREEGKLLARQLPLKQVELAILQNHNSKNVKQNELMELDNLTNQQVNLFRQSLHTLQSQIENWKAHYLLKSAVAGQMFFSTILEENQTINANQEVFFVGPKLSGYLGEALIPQQNLGKVRIGQRVMIKFIGYPFQEYGTVFGNISSISEIPNKDSSYLAKINLPNGLLTTYGQRITYRTGMNAVAEIVTDDTKLIEKLFNNLRKAIAK